MLRGVWQVVAEKDLERGEDVVLNYGPLSNDILLLDYGFLMPNNVNDRVELRYDGQLLDTACLVAKVESACSFKRPAPWQQQLLSRLKLEESGSSQSVLPSHMSRCPQTTYHFSPTARGFMYHVEFHRSLCGMACLLTR